MWRSIQSLCLLLLPVALVTGMELNVIVMYNGHLVSNDFYLRGDNLGLNWNDGVKMYQNASDTWQYTLEYSTTDVGNVLEMKPLQNDEWWSIGSNFMVVLPADSASVTIYPWFWSTSGEYKVVGSLYSPQLDNYRDIIVYTPPSYYENTLKPMNNVLIMHDGQNLFNASTSYAGIAWLCQDTVNKYVDQGEMEEVLIVGIYNTPDRINEYTYSYDPCYQQLLRCTGGGGLGDLYLDFIVQNVIPYAKQNFPRIGTNRENLGILGSSLGGLISCYAGWTRSSVFSKVGCMSSSFWWNRRDFNSVVMEAYEPPQQYTEFYLDSGDCCPPPASDDHYQTKEVLNHMEEDGWNLGEDLFYYLDQGGQHSEWYWGHRFWVPMTDLYPPSATPTTPL